MGNADIIFYGERGVVNGIILDIKDDINKLRGFFRAIDMADGGKLDWADDVEKCVFFVEPCFAEFGNPDLIAKVETTAHNKYVLFIEAKLKCYDDSSIKVDGSLLPKNYSGNASKINIQLAFKYRFIEAFKACKGKNVIEEDSQSAEIYNDSVCRCLKKPIVVEKVCEMFKDAHKYYFIAMTNDNKDTSAFASDNYLPPIGDKAWDKDKKLFGLLSYEALTTRGVIDRNNGYFGSAAELMLGKPADSAQPVKQVDGQYPHLKSLPFKEWTESQRCLAESVAEKFGFVVHKGSFSWTKGSCVLMKIVVDPENLSGILVGVRDDNIPDSPLCEKESVYMLGGGTWRKFRCYSVDESNLNELFSFISKYIDLHISDSH